MSDPIRLALQEIEKNANEMARLCIESGFPIATGTYAKNIAARLMEIDKLTRPIVAPPSSPEAAPQ